MDIKVLLLAHSSILLWDQSQTLLMKTFTKEKVMSEMGTLFLIEALLVAKDTTFFLILIYFTLNFNG